MVGLRSVVLWLAFFGIAASLAFGQGGNGTITGTVTDSTGAVIATATVNATNNDTGVVYSGASSAAGVYTISGLPVGNYSINAVVQGFKTYTHANLSSRLRRYCVKTSL